MFVEIPSLTLVQARLLGERSVLHGCGQKGRPALFFSKETVTSGSPFDGSLYETDTITFQALVGLSNVNVVVLLLKSCFY